MDRALSDGGSVGDGTNGVDVSRARAQHDAYVAALRSADGLRVATLPADEAFPDGVFAEDAVVAIGDAAVITRPGAPSRRGEGAAIAAALRARRPSLRVVDDAFDDDDDATCDGGDVLAPGPARAFVGLTRRTNAAGVDALRAAFPDVDVVAVPVVVDDDDNDEPLHLKSVVTHLDERTLLAPDDDGSATTRRIVDALTGYGHEVLRLPDPKACNVVSVNGTVLARDTDCAETRAILRHAVEKERGWRLVFLDMSEFEKCDGSLTCSCVLLK